MIKSAKCLAFVAAVLICASSSFAIQAEIVPTDVLPGDAYIVRVSGIESSQKTSVVVDGTEVPLDQCGDGCAFGIGAVDIGTVPGEKSVVINSGDSRLTIALRVEIPTFPEFRLNLPEREVILGPEDLERAKREDQMLKDIWKQTGPRLYRNNFILPLPNPVSAVFGARRIMNDKLISIHRGIDLKGRQGEKILAANDGRIVLAENLFFGGNTLIIDHGSGIYSIYMHLDRFAANTGEMVSRGDTIGFVGSTGRATGPHLHFGVKILSINANPLSLTKLKINDK